MKLHRACLAAAALVLLVACGSPAQESQGSSEPVELDVAIADGELTPKNEQVDVTVGQEVIVRVTSDAEDELHVHGEPEATWDVTAGMEDEEFSYVPQIPGQIAIESHGLHVTIATLVVTR